MECTQSHHIIGTHRLDVMLIGWVCLPYFIHFPNICIDGIAIAYIRLSNCISSPDEPIVQ